MSDNSGENVQCERELGNDFILSQFGPLGQAMGISVV